MNSYKVSLHEKNVSILITTRCQWSKFHFSARKMSDFLILNWGGRLTRTKQLIDCGLTLDLVTSALSESVKIKKVFHDMKYH